jgi:hypothetical protein
VGVAVAVGVGVAVAVGVGVAVAVGVGLGEGEDVAVAVGVVVGDGVDGGVGDGERVALGVGEEGGVSGAAVGSRGSVSSGSAVYVGVGDAVAGGVLEGATLVGAEVRVGEGLGARAREVSVAATRVSTSGSYSSEPEAAPGQSVHAVRSDRSTAPKTNVSSPRSQALRSRRWSLTHTPRTVPGWLSLDRLVTGVRSSTVKHTPFHRARQALLIEGCSDGVEVLLRIGRQNV